MGFMAEQESNAAYYGGGGTGFGGGAWAMILLVVVVLWVLFKDGHGRDEHRDGFIGFPGFGGGCGPCVQPTFKDESNFEEERNINAKLCCIDKDIWETDRDVWKTACETQKEIACDGQKTRALIEQNYIQDLRDKLAEKNDLVMTLKQEMFTEKKFDQLERMNEHRFDQIAAAIGTLQCEIPKRPPVFAECVTPNTHDIDCDDRRPGRFPRRGRCDFDDCCGNFA